MWHHLKQLKYLSARPVSTITLIPNILIFCLLWFSQWFTSNMRVDTNRDIYKLLSKYCSIHFENTNSIFTVHWRIMISSLNFLNKYFLGLLFCIVSSIDATVRNCTNSSTNLTTIKEMFGSGERKYCRYLGVKRLDRTKWCRFGLC